MGGFSLKDKIVVITGGSNVSGIGFAIAEEFLKKNVKIIILLDITDAGIKAEKQLNSKYGAEKVMFIKCDVTTDLDDISETIFEKYKKVDILVNSAGVINETSIRKSMEVNAIALIEWSMKFYEHMRSEKEGTIINISSIYGFRIDRFSPFYKASKFAVVGFSRTLGHESNYENTKVRVLVLCPGFTKTNFGQSSDCTRGEQEGLKEFFENIIWQDPGVVGKAAVDIFENGKSGTAWLIENGKCTEIVFQTNV